MAKKKTVSKIALVTESLRSQNQQISDLQKDVSELENIALLILEKVRRMEKYPVVQTKKGKLIPSKVGPGKSATLQAANDPMIGDTEKNTANDILMKIYNFMVKNAEKQRKEKDLEKNFEQENKQEKQRRYEKVVKEVGLDPSKLKKRGFLSTAGKLVKGTFWAGLGLAITGLIYLFRDEIKEFGKKLYNNISDLGNTIVKGLDFISGILKEMTKLYDEYVKPLIEKVKESSIFKGLTDSTKTLSGGVQETFKEIVDWVTNQITSLADTIMNFLSENLPKFIGNVLSSVMSTVMNYAKENPGSIATAIAGMFGPWWMKAIAALTGIKKTVTAVSGFAKDVRYGEESESKIKEAIGMDPHGVINKDNADDFQDVLDKPDILRKLAKKSPKETDKGYSERIQKQNKLLEESRYAQLNHINDLLKGTDYHIDMDSYNKDMAAQPTEIDRMKLDISPYIVDNKGTHLKSRKELYDLLGPLYLAKKVEQPLKSGIQSVAAGIKESVTGKINTARDEIVNSEKFKKLEEDVQHIKETTQEQTDQVSTTASRVYGQAKTKISETSDSARQTYSEVTSSPNPTQKASEIISEKASEGISATKSLFDDKVKPSLEKIDTGAFMEEAKNQYLKFSSLMSDLNDPEKRNEIGAKLQEFAQNPIEKIKEIGQDPAEDPFNLNAIFEQQRQASINNNVINTGSTTTGIEDYSAIPVRNLYSPFRNSNILSTVNP